jgi:hypothetical protein
MYEKKSCIRGLNNAGAVYKKDRYKTLKNAEVDFFPQMRLFHPHMWIFFHIHVFCAFPGKFYVLSHFHDSLKYLQMD